MASNNIDHFTSLISTYFFTTGVGSALIQRWWDPWEKLDMQTIAPAHWPQTWEIMNINPVRNNISHHTSSLNRLTVIVQIHRALLCGDRSGLIRKIIYTNNYNSEHHTMTILVVWRQAGGWVYYNISPDRCILYSPERKIDTFMIIWSSYLRYYYRIVQSRDCIPAVVSRPFGIGARRQERQSARWTSWLFLRMALYSLVAKRARALICFAAHVACCMLRLGDLCSFRGAGQMCARAQLTMMNASCGVRFVYASAL